MDPDSGHDANFVITGGIAGYSDATRDNKVGIMTTLSFQGERVIRFDGLSGDSRQQGPYSQFSRDGGNEIICLLIKQHSINLHRYVKYRSYHVNDLK